MRAHRHYNKIGSLRKCHKKGLDKEDQISCGWGMQEPSALDQDPDRRGVGGVGGQRGLGVATQPSQNDTVSSTPAPHSTPAVSCSC